MPDTPVAHGANEKGERGEPREPKYVVIHGDLDKGVSRIVGPFDGHQEAATYCLCRRNAWGYPVFPPIGDDARGWINARVGVKFEGLGGVRGVYGPYPSTHEFQGGPLIPVEAPYEA